MRPTGDQVPEVNEAIAKVNQDYSDSASHMNHPYRTKKTQILSIYKSVVTPQYVPDMYPVLCMQNGSVGLLQSTIFARLGSLHVLSESSVIDKTSAMVKSPDTAALKFIR